MKNIKIKAIAGDAFQHADFSERPRVSARVRESIVNLILRIICEPNKLILFDKYDYEFVFSLHKSISDAVIKDRVIVSERIRSGKKNIHVSIYDDVVSHDTTSSEYASLIFDGLKAFLTEKYKKISADEIEAVREQIDWNYINSLPFPAPFHEQQYILDANPNVEMAYRQQFGE